MDDAIDAKRKNTKPDDPKKQDKLLRLSRACERLDCSQSTLYRLIRAGKIATRRVGGGLRIPDSEIERIVAEGTR